MVVYKSESGTDGNAVHSSGTGADSGGHLPPHNSGFNSTITVLTRAFEIATTQMQVCGWRKHVNMYYVMYLIGF